MNVMVFVTCVSYFPYFCHAVFEVRPWTIFSTLEQRSQQTQKTGSSYRDVPSYLFRLQLALGVSRPHRELEMKGSSSSFQLTEAATGTSEDKKDQANEM